MNDYKCFADLNKKLLRNEYPYGFLVFLVAYKMNKSINQKNKFANKVTETPRTAIVADNVQELYSKSK